MMPVQSTKRDDKALRRIASRLRDLGSQEADVGVQGVNGGPAPRFIPRANADGTRARSPGTVATVASFHEFGTAMVPKRSFIAATTADNAVRTMVAHRMQQLAAEAIGGTSKPSLALAAKVLSEEMRRRISRRIAPPLGPWAAKAAARKRRDKRLIPLYDTRQIWKNIRYHVRRKRLL